MEEQPFPCNRKLDVPHAFTTKQDEYFYFLDGLHDTTRKPSLVFIIAALEGTFPELRTLDRFEAENIEANTVAYQVYMQWLHREI